MPAAPDLRFPGTDGPRAVDRVERLVGLSGAPAGIGHKLLLSFPCPASRPGLTRFPAGPGLRR